MANMIRYKQTAVGIGRVLVPSIKTVYREIRDHPFLAAFVLFLYLLRSFCPVLFGFLVESSPVILCTTLLLGTLLSYGDPIIPEIEEEEEEDAKEKEKSGHVVSSLQVHGTVDDLVIKTDNAVVSIEDHVEASKDVSFESEGEIFTDVRGDVGRTRRDVNLMGSSSAEEQQLEMTRRGKVTDEGAHLDLDQLKPDSRSWFYSLQTPLERHADFSDSDSDGAESSSPDASMADILPVLDELHPLLDAELSRPIHVNIDDSDDTSEVSSDESSQEDDGEDREGVEDVKEGDDRAAIAWTADDLKNVMELGTIELERNRRLENMIAKRRARRNLEARNLMGLDQAALDRYSRLKISSISTRKANPFDYLNDSEENKDLPPIPGSAPSVLSKKRNPFEFPYLSAGTESTSRLPFMPGRNHPSEEQKESGSDPEKIVTDQSSYCRFKRQLSEMRDYKLSNIPEFESVSVASAAAGDDGEEELEEDRKDGCDEHEINLSSRHEAIPSSFAADRGSSSDDFALEESDERQEAESIPYSTLPQNETPSADYTLLEPLISSSSDNGDLQQNISEMYSRQMSKSQGFFQIDENSEDDESGRSESGDLPLESLKTSVDELVIPDYLTYGAVSENIQTPLEEAIDQPDEVGMEESNTSSTDDAQRQLSIDREGNQIGDVEESILSELDAVGDFSVQHLSLDGSLSDQVLLRDHSSSGSVILASSQEDHPPRNSETALDFEKTDASEFVEDISITAEGEVSIVSTLSLSDMQEVEARSLEDLQVLKQLTEAGADSPRYLSPDSYGIHFQSLEEGDVKLDKEEDGILFEEVDQILEIRSEPENTRLVQEQIAGDMHREKVELHEIEPKLIEDMHVNTKQKLDDDQEGIDVEPFKERNDHNVQNESIMEPNMEIQSDIDEIEAETLEDIDLALKQIFRQNTLILERGSGSKDIPAEFCEPEKLVEPDVEVQSNDNKEEVQSVFKHDRQQEAEIVSSGLGAASDKVIETKLDLHLNMHEVELSSCEDLNSILKETSEGSVSYSEIHEGSSSELEEQAERQMESYEKRQSNLHEVEAKSKEDIVSAFKKISEESVDVPDRVIEENTEKQVEDVLGKDEKITVTSQPEESAVKSGESFSNSN